MRSGAPPLARWLAGVLLPARVREFVLGDLDELHAGRLAREGRRRADGRYRREAALSVLALRFGRGRGRSGHASAIGGNAGGGAGPTRPPGGGAGRLASELLADLARAPRTLGRDPGFTALVALTLALGVGATAAVFGMVNQLVLRPLPGVADPAGAAYLTFVRAEEPDGQGAGVSLMDFDALREGATLLEGMASYGHTSLRLFLGDERPIAARANTIYGDFFEVLGVRPAEGRLLTADDTRLGTDPRVAVIGEELRARLFAPGEPVVGRTIVANGETVTIVGVAGGGFRGPERGEAIDMWIPHAALTALLGFPEEALTSRNSVMHRNVVVRPGADVHAAAAEAQLTSLMEHVVATVPESAEWLGALRPRLDPGLHLPPLWRASTYGTLRLLAGVVALVLLIACANVANLFLFRNLARRGALATRRALGASSGRLARHQLAESLWLGLLGTVLGLAVAWAIVLPFRGERLLRMLPAFEGFVVDGRVAAFAAGLVVITTVLFGVVPAALAGRFDLDGALRDAGGRDTPRGAWLRRMVSAAQVALCLTLLVGGLLLARTIRNLYTVDTGYDLADVSAVYLETRDVPAGSTLHDFGQRLLEAVGTVLGVTGAALDVYPPHGPTLFGRAGLPGVDPREAPRAITWPVTPTWFDVVGVAVERGRALQPGDAEPGAPRVTVLTPALARRLFGDADPIGRTVEAGFYALEPLEVVGLTEDLRHARSPDEVLEGFFVPFARDDVPTLSVLVRTRSQDAGTLARIRAALETVVPDQPVPDPQTLASLLDDVHAERRLVGRLLALLSALAVGLAAVGLYGAIAFAAAGRTREFGIRLALGARADRIARLVVVDALGIVVFGTAGGLLGAWLLGRVLESRLYGVAPVDPASYVAATLLFAAVALLACWTPARRATRVDPVHTLKGE